MSACRSMHMSVHTSLSIAACVCRAARRVESVPQDRRAIKYIGHNYIGQICIGHNCIGHNYIGRRGARGVESIPQECRAAPPHSSDHIHAPQVKNIYQGPKISIKVQKYLSRSKSVYQSQKYLSRSTISIKVPKYLSRSKSVYQGQKYLSRSKNIYQGEQYLSKILD